MQICSVRLWGMVVECGVTNDLHGVAICEIDLSLLMYCMTNAAQWLIECISKCLLAEKGLGLRCLCVEAEFSLSSNFHKLRTFYG